MKSGQTMLARTVGAVITLGAALTLCSALSGCSSEPKLKSPEVLAAPYDTSAGEVLWAVAPLRNESGTTLFDVLDVSDKVIGAAGQVRGVRVLPLNRTILAMRALKLSAINSPAEARRLAQELGVDGLILGSVTAYDPYDPPKLGLALALYTRPGRMDRGAAPEIDPRALSQRGSDPGRLPGSHFDDSPASVVSEFLDGNNHQVLMDLKEYAEGRHDRTAALAWRRYLASMDLFSEFAAWHAVGRLLDQEWVRLAKATPEDGTP